MFSSKMLCQSTCGSLDPFQFLTVKKASAEKASVILLYENSQSHTQQILSSLVSMWRFTSERARAWGLNSSLTWTSGVSSQKLDQIKSIPRQHLSWQDKMGSLLFLWDSDLIISFCHSHFLSPLANPPGFTADVWSLLEIIVQAKRLVSYRLQALGNTNGKLFTQKVRWGDKWRVCFGPLKMLGAWTKLTH